MANRSQTESARSVAAMGDKHNMYVSSDAYFNNPSRWEDLSDYANIIPVDSGGAVVPTQKHDPMNFKNAQSAIHERFDLHNSGELNPEDGF